VALGEEALKCEVAILDINLGPNQPSGIEAYAWLRQKGYTGRIVFLTGHASNHPLVIEASRIGDAEVFSKPVEPARLRSIVEGHDQ
jgi:FixJ family two-component response regulator